MDVSYCDEDYGVCLASYVYGDVVHHGRSTSERSVRQYFSVVGHGLLHLDWIVKRYSVMPAGYVVMRLESLSPWGVMWLESLSVDGGLYQASW